MNHEARQLANQLRKVVKANARKLKDERKVHALYAKIEKQNEAILTLQAETQRKHANIGTLPFHPSGATK